MDAKGLKIMNKYCVIGLGYIGLPTAAVLASLGNNVIGVDINNEVVETINKGKIHIVEPGLDQIVSETVSSGKLKAKNIPEESDVFIIAVQTPYKNEEDSIPKPSIDYVLNASRSIAKVVKPNDLILLESTSPVGTTEEIANLISNLSGLSLNKFYVSFCPERVFPGKILYELINNDRLVGGINQKSSDYGASFYASFCKGKIYKTNARTAELSKLAENSFRDVNIAFANELSMVCDKLNIDVSELIKLINYHPRVNVLQPGCGVGGHCIAVDPWFIASAAPEITPLIQTARNVNNEKTKWVIDKIKLRIRSYKKIINREPKVACLGLAYKPNIDDLRESPALQITSALIDLGFHVLPCEPNLVRHPIFTLNSLEFVLENADLIVLLVAHDQFKDINFLNYEILDFCGLSSI